MLTIVQWLNVLSITYGVIVCLCKFTIFTMYRALFVTQRISFVNIKICCYEVFVGGFYLALTLVTMMECLPRQKIWLTTMPGKCGVNKSKLLLVSGIINLVTDVQVMAIPTYSISKLKMKGPEKLRVLSVFAIGLLQAISSPVSYVSIADMASALLFSVVLPWSVVFEPSTSPT
jgi:hypothetical protein